MIPDKIYLAWEYSEIDTLPPGVTAKQVFGKDVCYIRKDALMEWAKDELNKLEALSDNDAVHWGQRNAFKQMIDKLNSM